ncbi:hypothetical protein HAX54_040536 [Datura stramonium]|uniref:Uncharacterized protein n=1 Tax=Datura stramonium TaxID=4076 RepID=A0ABS8SK99_DATST|nr:hypothetical protein [Datura stramonium]
MEYNKLKAMKALADRVKDEVSIEQLYASVRQELKRALDIYYPFSTRQICSDNDYWSGRMFFDGCFIIEFIDSGNVNTTSGCREPRPRRSWLNMKKHDRDLVWRDLLLLTNQIPFHVLDLLSRAFKCETFFNSELLTTRFLQMPLLNISSSPNPTFLDYYKRRQRFPVCDDQGPSRHLLQIYRDLWINVLLFKDDEEEEEEEEEDHLAPAFSVTELKKVGIRCCCASDHGHRPTNISPLSDIRLKSSTLSAKLFLPQLTISEWSMTLFYNLFAYEYSCRSLQHRSFEITSYLSFMSMLISGEDDVKELRDRGVLQLNLKDGDDQVVNFFRDIAAHHEPNLQAFRYVKRQISTYCNSKCLNPKIACAEFKKRYFSGPWSFLVFLAVIFTVGMTVIQTVLTFIQTYK